MQPKAKRIINWEIRKWNFLKKEKQTLIIKSMFKKK